jgi:hypothetical protein
MSGEFVEDPLKPRQIKKSGLFCLSRLLDKKVNFSEVPVLREAAHLLERIVKDYPDACICAMDLLDLAEKS